MNITASEINLLANVEDVRDAVETIENDDVSIVNEAIFVLRNALHHQVVVRL